MLSKFQFYDPETITENCNKNKQELPNKSAILRSLDSLTNITALDKDKTEPTECRILSPHWIEYLLIFWVFSFTCQELTQVSVFQTKVKVVKLNEIILSCCQVEKKSF